MKRDRVVNRFSRRNMLWSTAAGSAALVPWARAAVGAETGADLLLRNGLLYDGTGREPVKGDVGVRGSRIVAVGQVPRLQAARVIDCSGLVVAPGFIDLHTHSDRAVSQQDSRRSANYLLQGCTLMVTGNCGMGPFEVGKFLAEVDRVGMGTHIIHLLPHGAVRRAAMGNARRDPTGEELQRMRQLTTQAMREGAWGVSTGLIYLPGTYSKTPELIEVAKVVALHGGLYASHIRDDGAALLDAVREAIQVGREARLPVQISHFKVKGKPNWGILGRAMELVDQARAEGLTVTADQYPYTASSTSMSGTLLPDTQIPGGRADVVRRMAGNTELTAVVRRVIAQYLAGSEKIVIAKSRKHPEYNGRSVTQLAADQSRDPVDLVLDILAEEDPSVVNHAMCETDVRQAMAAPWMATASDGAAMAIRPGEMPHPRNFGTFARKVGRYALREHVLSPAQAIHTCTGLPARILGLTDRGLLREGFWADLAVFDPATFIDTATFEAPQQYATGMKYVFVEGHAAVDDGQVAPKTFGRALRHASARIG